jgi:hypothetical protein
MLRLPILQVKAICHGSIDIYLCKLTHRTQETGLQHVKVMPYPRLRGGYALLIACWVDQIHDHR